MNQYNDDETEALYHRFKDSLGHKGGEYFDEDDIIDVFDTAGDLNDDYVRMEALLYAARYFPESMAMADRRAIFYNGYSDAMRDSYLADHPEPATFIMSVLRLLSANPEPEEAIGHIDRLVAGADQLNDEEMIQLVDAAASLGAADWLFNNIQLLKSKTQYQTTLLYEMDIVFENVGRYDLCEKVLEELTLLEPFNSEFWRLLAQTYLELENYDQAASAIDYALAIDPDDETAKVVKAEVLFRSGDSAKLRQAIDILEPVMEKDPSREDIYRPLSLCYLTGDFNDKLGKLLDKLQPLHPADEWVAGTFMHLNPDKSEQAIRDYSSSGAHTEEDWVKLAMFIGDTYPSIGADVLIEAGRNIGLTTGWEILFRFLYNAGRYEDIYNIVQDCPHDSPMRPNFTHEMSMLLVRSMLNIGDRYNALAYARAWLNSFHKEAPDDNPATGVALDSVALFMEKIIEDYKK